MKTSMLIDGTILREEFTQNVTLKEAKTLVQSLCSVCLSNVII
jgi:hypothetical protein